MDKEQILAKLAGGELTVEEAGRLLSELERKKGDSLYCKVSPKGAISVYGLQKFPVTLYTEQWERLLAFGDEIRKFGEDHAAELKHRDR